MDLKQRKWKEFLISKLFEINATSSGIDKNKLNMKQGKIPYITRSDDSNGNNAFVCDQDSRYKKNDGNVITIGLDTQTVFYQSHKFYTGQNIQILRNNHISKEVAMFLIPLIKRQMEKFNWGGNGATLTRIAKQKILLPVTAEDKPDYSYMEAYIHFNEQRKMAEYKQLLAKKLQSLEEYKKFEPLENKRWKEFLFPKIFKIEKGFYNKKPLASKNGKVPFLGATSISNGITQFSTIDSINSTSKMGYGKNHHIKKKIFKGNCIAVTNNGSVGYAFYQCHDFTCSHDINPLYLRAYPLNEMLAKFLITAIEKQRVCFEYARKWRPARMKKSKILLPITSEGKPDYSYMENYTKHIEYKKLADYCKHKSIAV